MKEGPAELFRCCLQTSALSKSTVGLAQEPRSRRGLVLKHDKAIIDLPDRENSTKKTQGTGEREGWNVPWRGQGQVTRGVGQNPNNPDAKSLSFGKLGLACKNKQKNTAGLASSLID